MTASLLTHEAAPVAPAGSYNPGVARKPYRLAAIDVGTNSIHMIVVEALRRGFKVVDKEKEMVQLGRGSLEGRPLTKQAMERGIAALRKMGELARNLEVSDIIAVATSAVREASNGKQFIREAEEKAGIRIRIISGEEEADYIYRAVRSSIDFNGGTALCIDIGGGSVEFIVATDRQVFFTRSEPLGVLRVTEGFLKNDPPTAEDIAACREAVRERLRKPLASVRKIGFDFCIGTSGTINTLAEIGSGSDTLISAGLRELTLEQVQSLIVTLQGLTAAERAERFSIEPRRADTILGGAIVLDEIMQLVRIDSLRANSAALREGLVEKQLQERKIIEGSRESVRRQAVLDLMERSEADRAHAAQVARLALRIFDQTTELHHLRPIERELLEEAALLHEVGMQVSFEQYHKHTYYLIRHAGLRGFTDDQIALLANVARYHRKSVPSAEHENLLGLRTQQRSIVEKLAAILRIADALDRSRRQAVRDIGVQVKHGRAEFHVRARHDVSVEMESVMKRGKYFATLFGVEVEFRERDE